MKRHLALSAAAMAILAAAPSPLAAQAKEPWQDLAIIQQGNEPARATFDPVDLTAGAARNLSLSLNGPWQFRMLAKPSDRGAPFETAGFDASEWARIQVPSNWEREGFGYPVYSNIPYPFHAVPFVVPTDDQNQVGQYRRTFDVPADWSGKRVYVRFGAVSSAYTLWVNGKRIGYSEDRRTPVTFDITDALVPGKNLIAVEVYRWSDGSWLENQDGWSLSGIYRNVDLFARNPLHIADFEALTSLTDNYATGVLDLGVTLNGLGKGAAARVDYEIALGGARAASGSLPLKGAGQATDAKRRVTVPAVATWSAETPNLYDLTLVLRDAAGRPVERIEQKIGFRSVELKQGLVLINGRPVKFRGVNIHEFHPRTGYLVDEATVRKDFQLLAEGNFNAIRTSHYPQAELLYRLADEYGFYVIDEANMETHKLRGSELAPARRPEWAEALLDRSRRMLERDKNHPSIVIWSPGNESGTGQNITAVYNWFKRRDPTRLAQWADDTSVEGEGVSGYAKPRPYGKASDFLSAFYPSYWDLDHFGQVYGQTEPWIMAEYWHSMGNSLGNGKEFWDTIYKHPALQGGFIWDWVDQGLEEHDANGRLWYGHGGDYGPPGTPSSDNFLHNGVIFPDRTVKPAYWDVKKAYQPAKFEALDLARGQFAVENRNGFLPLSAFDLGWTLLEDGTPVASGVVSAPAAAPGETVPVTIAALAARTLDPGREYMVNLDLKVRTPTPLLRAGHVVASEQFAVPFGPVGEGSASTGSATAVVTDSGKAIEVAAAGTVVRIDRASGFITALKADGRALIEGPLVPNTWRPLTDNDVGFAPETWDFDWRGAGGGAKLISIDRRTIDGAVVIDTRHLLPDGKGQPMADWYTSYRIAGDGTVAVSARFVRRDGVRMPPRVGMRVKLPQAFDRLEYYGRGPHENYADRKWSAQVGRYTADVAAMYTPYLRPQENGHRTDARWFSLRDGTGAGVLILGTKPLGFNALPHAQEAFEVSSERIRNAIVDRGNALRTLKSHLNDVPATSDGTYVSIDAVHSGVGGDNSWGKRTMNQYTPRDPEYAYGFVIVPVKGGTDIAEAARLTRARYAAK